MTTKKARIFVFMNGSLKENAPKLEDKKHEINAWLEQWRARRARPLVTTHRIAIHIYRILLGAPQILFRFIGLRLLVPLLDGCEAFPFLVSLPYRLRALAADNKSGAND
jgi:hypothetical protein